MRLIVLARGAVVPMTSARLGICWRLTVSGHHVSVICRAISGDKVSPKDQGELSGVLKDAGYTKDQVYKF